MNNKMQSVTIHEGIGDDAIEMTVQVTQEELNKMEQLRQLNPDKWVGKDLELIQEVRIIRKEDFANRDREPGELTKQARNSKVSGEKIAKICAIALLWLLLIIYKIALISMQKEVNEMHSLIGGYDITENIFSSRETGEINGLFLGMSCADYQVLIPFSRLLDASAELSLKHNIENGIQLSEADGVLLDAIRLNVETQYLYGRNNTKWEVIGLQMPVILETLFWLLLAFFSIRKIIRIIKSNTEQNS